MAKLFTEYKKEDKFSIFSNVWLVKRLANFALLVSIIVFMWLQSKKIDDIEMASMDNLKVVALTTLLIWLAWRAISMILRNNTISIRSQYISYIYSLGLIIYIYLLAFLNIIKEDALDESWVEMIRLNYVWIIPIFGLGAFWKVSNAIVEWKIRRYFSIQELWKALNETCIISMVLIIWWGLDKYLFGHSSFPDTYLGTLNLFILFMGGFSFILWWISFYKIIKGRKFTKAENIAIRATFYPKLLIASFILLVLFVTMVMGTPVDGMDYVYIAVVIVLTGFMFFVASTSKETNGKSIIYLLLLSLTLLLMTALMFVFNKWSDTDIGVTVSSMLTAIFTLSLLNYIVKPLLGKVTKLLFGIFMVFTAIFVIAVYVLYMAEFSTVLTSSILPFDLLQLLEIIPVAASTLMVLVHSLVFYLNSRRLSISASKLIKYEKKEEALND